MLLVAPDDIAQHGIAHGIARRTASEDVDTPPVARDDVTVDGVAGGRVEGDPVEAIVRDSIALHDVVAGAHHRPAPEDLDTDATVARDHVALARLADVVAG